MLSEFRRNICINLRKRGSRRLKRTFRTTISDRSSVPFIVFPPRCSEAFHRLEKSRRIPPSHATHHHKHGPVGRDPHTPPERLHRREKALLVEDLPPGRHNFAICNGAIVQSEYSRGIV